MFEEQVTEIVLSISGPAPVVAKVRTLIGDHQNSVGAEDPAVFAALLPIEGSSRDEQIDWCIKNWGTFWADSDNCPEHLLGDRETEIREQNKTDVQESNLTGFDSIEIAFYTATGCPTPAVEQISKKWPDLMLVVGWDDPSKRTLGASTYRNGNRKGHYEMAGDNYPSPSFPESDDPNELYDAVEEWLRVRNAAISKATKIAMGISDDDLPSADDDTYERPVHATGVPSEENHGEFIIAEVQNGKYSATIVTVPPTALSGSDHIEIFPTMSKYRVLAGVSTDWFDRLICEANGWDYDSDDTPEMSDDELDNNPGMQEAINKIMAESMVRIAVYFKAKGLTI